MKRDGPDLSEVSFPDDIEQLELLAGKLPRRPLGLVLSSVAAADGAPGILDVRLEMKEHTRRLFIAQRNFRPRRCQLMFVLGRTVWLPGTFLDSWLNIMAL